MRCTGKWIDLEMAILDNLSEAAQVQKNKGVCFLSDVYISSWCVCVLCMWRVVCVLMPTEVRKLVKSCMRGWNLANEWK